MFTNFIPNITRVLSKYWGLFLQGMGMTLLLSFITVFFGTILGSLLALMRRSRFKPVSGIAVAYVELIRGTPLLLQLYFFYFMLPELLPMLNLSKFACIVRRAGVQLRSLCQRNRPRRHPGGGLGQTEAARTLGLNASQTMLRIVMPQAVKNILPALGNEFVTVIKETSLASTFFVGDLMTQYNTIRGNMFLVLEPLIVVGVIYFILTFSLSKADRSRFERRLKASD